MKIVLLITFIVFLFICVSLLLSKSFFRCNPINFYDIYFGFSVIMSVYFAITRFAVNNGASSSEYHLWIGLASLFIITLSLYGIPKLKSIKINYLTVLFVVAYMIFAIILSMRYTLGEQMGDSIYLFFYTNKNIDTPLLNAFDQFTGEVNLNIVPDLYKAYVSFYIFFSSIYHYLEPVFVNFKINYVPPYVLNMWITNLLFYFFSAGLIIDLLSVLKIKSFRIYIPIVLWIGVYTGSIYYNITLPHIVVTYLVLNMGFLSIMLFQYFQNFDRKLLFKISVLLYSMNAFGGTGAMFIMLISFGIVTITLLNKYRDAFIQIPLFLVAILEYVYIMFSYDSRIKYLIYVYLFILLLCIIVFKIKILHNLTFKLTPYLLCIVWIGLLYFSVNYIDNYWAKVQDFSVPQFAADRTQDYFSFVTFNMTIRNIFYYLLLIAMLTYKETRMIGYFVLILFLFFVNPFMKPWVSENLARYDVYNRSFFTIFNNGTLGMGIFALLSLVSNGFYKSKNIVFGLLIVLMLIPTYNQVTGYYYPSYMPQVKDYNPLYKMGESQIEVLESIRQIIEIEELENPKIVSQIFGTAMYAPEFVTLGFNVNQQRYGPVYIGDALYEIFYTPAIPGDHRPFVNYDLRTTCQLLVDLSVDFVVINKSFSVYDQKVGDYLTIYWYVDRCGGKLVHENIDYIAYRFFRW